MADEKKKSPESDYSAEQLAGAWEADPSSALKVGTTVPGNVVRNEFGQVVQNPSVKVGRDVEGNKTFYKPNQPSQGDIYEPSWQQNFARIFREGPDIPGGSFIAPAGIVKGLLVHGSRIGGATLGASVGGPITAGTGAALGAATGSQVYTGLQHAVPDLFGAPPSDVKSNLAQMALDTGTEFVPDVASKFGKVASKRVFSSEPFWSHAIDQEHPSVHEALNADPGMELTIGQATNNPIAIALESLFGGKAFRRLQLRQQQAEISKADQFIKDLSGGTIANLRQPAADIASEAAGRIQAKNVGAKGISDELWQRAEQDLIPQEKANVLVKTGQEQSRWVRDETGQNLFREEKGKDIYTPTEIKGPVELRYTLENAKTMLDDINRSLEDPTNILKENPNSVKSLNTIKSRLEEILNSPLEVKNGQTSSSRLQPYEALKQITTFDNDTIEGMSGQTKKRLLGQLTNLRNSISKDIELSAVGDLNKGISPRWDANTGSTYMAANDAFKARNVFKTSEAEKMLEQGNPAYTAAMDAATRDRQAAQRFNAAVGDKGLMAAYITKNIFDSARSMTEKNNMAYFDGTKAWNALQGYMDSGVAKEAFSSDQLQALKYMLNRFKAVDPSLVNSGKVALAIRAGGAGILLTSGLASGLFTGNPNANRILTGGIILGSIPLAHNLVKNLMLNPTNARMVAQLSSLPPKSATAQDLMRQLIKRGAFEGTMFNIEDSVNGGRAVAVPDKKSGKLNITEVHPPAPVWADEVPQTAAAAQ